MPAEANDLHAAARSGKLEDIERLLAEGCDVNARDDDGATALCAAAFSDQVDAVKLLLARGADPRARMTKGEYELHSAVEIAIRCANPEILEAVLGAGGTYEPDLGGPGRTWKPMNNAFAAVLLDKRSPGPVKRSYAREALADMARVLVKRPPLDDDAPLVRVARLVADHASERDRTDAGVLIDATDRSEAEWTTAIAEGYAGPRGPDAPPPSLVDRFEDAARRGDAKTVAKLLKRRELEDEGLFDRGRACTALLEAVRGGHLDVVALIAKKADISAWTRADGQYTPETALGIALARGHLEIARYLATAGARPDTKSPWGASLDLTFALLEELVADPDAWVDHYQDQSPLSSRHCTDVAELAWFLDEMAKHGGKRSKSPATPALLVDAILHDDVARATVLLERGASPDAPLGEVPPLDLANRIGAAEVAELLSARGAKAKRHLVLGPRLSFEGGR